MTPVQGLGFHATLLESGIPPGGSYWTWPKSVTHALIGNQRFGAHNFWNLAYAKNLSLHIHTPQSYRRLKWNNQMKKNKKAQTWSCFQFEASPMTALPPSHPSLLLQQSHQRLFPLWLEMSWTRDLPVRTLDGARWESLCSDCSRVVFSARSFLETAAWYGWFHRKPNSLIFFRWAALNQSVIKHALSPGCGSAIRHRAESNTAVLWRSFWASARGHGLTNRCLFTLLRSFWSPATRPNSIAWRHTIRLCLLGFVLAISSLRKALLIYFFISNSDLYQAQSKRLLPWDTFPDSSSLIPCALSAAALRLSCASESPGGWILLPVFPI